MSCGTKIEVESTGSWLWFVEKARALGHEACLSHPKQGRNRRKKVMRFEARRDEWLPTRRVIE